MLGVFLDTETNGLDWSKHIILEISFIIKNLFTGEAIDSYEGMIKPNIENWTESDPRNLSYTKINLNILKGNGKDITRIQQEITNILKK